MPRTSHRHQRSVVPTCTRGRNWQRPCMHMPSRACKREDRLSGVPARETLDDRKSVFRSIWRIWSLFPGWIEALGRHTVSAIRISQVVAFSRTRSVHLNQRIEGTENACPLFSGGRFCQVVARTGVYGTTLAKKKNHPRDSRREERCSTCDIMLDQARSAQGKSRGQSRIGLALRWSRLIEHDITRGTAFFSPRISMMVLFFVQGSSFLYSAAQFGSGSRYIIFLNDLPRLTHTSRFKSLRKETWLTSCQGMTTPCVTQLCPIKDLWVQLEAAVCNGSWEAISGLEYLKSRACKWIPASWVEALSNHDGKSENSTEETQWADDKSALCPSLIKYPWKYRVDAHAPLFLEGVLINVVPLFVRTPISAAPGSPRPLG